MIQFLCMYFPPVIFISILSKYYKKKFEIPQDLFSYCICTIAINFTIFEILTLFFGYKEVVLDSTSFNVRFSIRYMSIAIVLAILFACITIYRRRYLRFSFFIKLKQKESLKIRTIILCAVIVISLLLSFVLFLGSDWLINTFGLLSPDELLFHLFVPLEGSNNDVILDFIWNCLSTCVIMSFIYLISLFVTRKMVITCIISFREKTIRELNLSCIFHRLLLMMVPITLVVSCIYTYINLDFGEYIAYMATDSTFIEDNYVDPQKTRITFPEERRNLIYIFMESVETTYLSTDLGGYQSVNLMPELTLLAEENINFSNSELLGGALQVPGTSWTVGAMVAQTSGLPLEVPIDGNSYGDYSSFFPGAYTLGQLLEEEGYNQTLLVGSAGSFGGRSYYFEQHGNYTILDYSSAIENEVIAEDYHVFWGFEDEYLYSYAKNEITKMAEEDEPFNFTMLTVDTHHPSGYICNLCGSEYEDQFSNVISCASRQVYEFVTWIQEQDFYENTTIIICGDHLSMNAEFFVDVSESYDRTTFNVIINSVVDTEYNRNRQFATFDMFPTTLASLGVTIEGEKLGMGTNLFSGVATLVETEGYENTVIGINSNSIFYNETFLYP